MTRTLYVPAYTADIARQKIDLFEGREPFYWREPQAAHEAADWHYPDGKVFAITKHDDGTTTVRQHVLGEPEPLPAPVWTIDRVGEIGAGLVFLVLMAWGFWACGKATLS